MQQDSLPQNIQEVYGHVEKLIIELLKDGIRCPKNFSCYKSKYESVCKAGFVGKLGVLCCLEENPQECIFSLLSNEKYYCQCTIRKYLAKKFGK